MLFRFACLLLFPLILAACSSDDKPGSPADPDTGTTTPPAPEPDTIKIECEPDSLAVRWRLAGPDEYQLSGCSDRTLPDMPAGQYTLTWLEENDWTGPDPAEQTLELATGDYLIFSGDYQVNPIPEPLKILFLGSSYFGSHDVDQQFQELALAAGKDVEIHSRIRGGYLLPNHLDDTTSLRIINEQPWDYVLLQGGGIALSIPEWHYQIMPYIGELRDLVHANNPNSRIIYMMPWAFKNGLTWMEGRTERWRTQQEYLYNYSLQMANDWNIGVAPVGWVWGTIRDGEFPQDLFSSDGNHPSRCGSYLTTCVFYCAVFHESVTGLTFIDELSEESAGLLQAFATEMVLTDLDLWNLICYQ